MYGKRADGRLHGRGKRTNHETLGPCPDVCGLVHGGVGCTCGHDDLSSIRADLSASFEALQWTVSAYNLSFGVLLLTGAALGDRFGRRRLFALGIVLFAGASIACASTH